MTVGNKKVICSKIFFYPIYAHQNSTAPTTYHPQPNTENYSQQPIVSNLPIKSSVMKAPLH